MDIQRSLSIAFTERSLLPLSSIPWKTSDCGGLPKFDAADESVVDIGSALQFKKQKNLKRKKKNFKRFYSYLSVPFWPLFGLLFVNSSRSSTTSSRQIVPASPSRFSRFSESEVISVDVSLVR